MAKLRNRVDKTFAALRARDEAALIAFAVAGDPQCDWTPRVIAQLEASGADIIELGVPFSDPMADGPVNQRASARGLAAGATLPAILSMVSELRRSSEIPIILFGYFNPIFRYGCARFCEDAAKAGVDGLLVIDLPQEESAELAGPARSANLDLIYVLAPTTPADRIKRIAQRARGFLYYVSVTGVTGARANLPADLREHISQVRSLTKIPVGVGFGISTPEQAGAVGAFADGVVVGSAISSIIEIYGATPAMLTELGNLVTGMKQAIKGARQATQAADAS